MKRITALLLSAVALVSALASCRQDAKETTADEKTITATSVSYSKSGRYTTTVSSENVDLSGLSIDNVEVKYANPYSGNMTAEELIKELSKNPEEDSIEPVVMESEAEEKPAGQTPSEERYPMSAKVESVEANGAGGKYLYLYYTKDKNRNQRSLNNACLSAITIDSNKWSSYKSDSRNIKESYSVPYENGLNGDLNQGAPGSNLFMYLTYRYDSDKKLTEEVSTGRLDTDPEYYPYCYTLGCKVSAYISPAEIDYRNELFGFFKNWTTDEENEFLRRMHFSDPDSELNAAGIRVEYTSAGLLARRDSHWIVTKAINKGGHYEGLQGNCIS